MNPVGKPYRILSTPNLLNVVWTTINAGVIGTAPENTSTVSSDGAVGFFKI